jgi:Glycosyltransferase like family 2
VTPAPDASPPAGASPPAPEAFLSGRVGHVGPRRAVVMRALDRLLDLELLARRVPVQLDRVAGAAPRRRVLALTIQRPGAPRADAVAEALAASRHDVLVARGQAGQGGKFQNLNVLLHEHDTAGHDWLLIADDDVVLPERFTDRMIGVLERLGLGLAQPAQTLASHAAWPVTRRHARSVARETAFVEIGPVTALRKDVAADLAPFPDLRFGWGLDLHWAAIARERGWRMGVVDALPVRHDEAGVASSYGHDEAVAEARRFLAGRDFVPSAEANRTLAVHRRLG